MSVQPDEFVGLGTLLETPQREVGEPCSGSEDASSSPPFPQGTVGVCEGSWRTPEAEQQSVLGRLSCLAGARACQARADSDLCPSRLHVSRCVVSLIL